MAIVSRATRSGAAADGASFILREADDCYYADEDAVSPLWKGRRFPMTSCISGWAMMQRQPVVVPDVTLDARIPQDVYRAVFVRSMVMMPVRSHDPIGAIGVYWARTHAPDNSVVLWLQALADATSAAIECVLAQQEVRELRARMRDSAPPMETGPVRMCAWTRRFWHKGRWISVEAFLHERYGIDVTHSISEEALEKLRRDVLRAAPNRNPQLIS